MMRVMLLGCVIMAALVASTKGTMEDDVKDCADQLTNLAACIPYVSGSAKKPTQQCCDDTMKVKTAKPKCLCVLIKESADPAMGLPVNTTLALQMPTVCNIDAKVSDCPSILKLPPDSPDAKIFKGATADTSSSSASTPPGSASDGSSSSSSSSTTAATTTSDSKVGPSSNNAAKMGNFAKASILFFLAAWMFT
ncbi:hypothetical protein Syun_011218 [Stephania yunnanensis]|uniref:Bifunctional inhibitor/plant lipid transfer protein/seed storage helical domain-containing protein n=1 Tax=Stephania yunnanensis TaxID=152371 RepID=A0AAP0PE80_9MAGN